MIQIKVSPGNCGFCTQMSFSADKNKTVNIEGISSCPKVQALIDSLEPVDGLKECFSRFDHSLIYREASQHLNHVACPVPMALTKGIEASCGFSLAQDVIVSIEKKED